jgi:hypothetical protein
MISYGNTQITLTSANWSNTFKQNVGVGMKENHVQLTRSIIELRIQEHIKKEDSIIL